MSAIQAALTVVTVLVVPYLVQAIKTKAMSGNAARWVAIAVSALCGRADRDGERHPDRPQRMGDFHLHLRRRRAGSLRRLQGRGRHVEVARLPSGARRREEGGLAMDDDTFEELNDGRGDDDQE